MEHPTAVVIGLGDSGLSAACWLNGQGKEVIVMDTRDHPPHQTQLQALVPQARLITGGFNREILKQADLIVSSPGVPLSTPELASLIAEGHNIVGDVELFAEALKVLSPQTRVIAITGSNGKTTTTSLVGAMCEAAGLKTMVAGNIGLPVLDALALAQREARAGLAFPDVFVLELSSFQLETTFSLNADAAAVLNISEDHLDRYSGLAAYATSKKAIFQGTGVQVLNQEDPFCLEMVESDRTVRWFSLDVPQDSTAYGLISTEKGVFLAQGETPFLAIHDLALQGLHNVANVLAAFALCEAIGLERKVLIETAKHFKGLPHRVEFVKEVNGVRYYDDSKGTNVGATEAALKGVDSPVVLIAGGDGKGQDFSPLRAPIEAHVRTVILIGRDAPLIKTALAGLSVPCLEAASLEEAVKLASTCAQKGDKVFLSPACASLDMFKNYVHRAEVFIQAVKALAHDEELACNS